MIRKSAVAIATIVVVIIVIAISITRANAQVVRVDVLDHPNVVQDVFDVTYVCVFDGTFVKDMTTDVQSEVEVSTAGNDVPNLVAVNDGRA